MRNLDYEVEYYRIGSCSSSSAIFFTEEEAIAFIKESRHKWGEYRLIKRQLLLIFEN